MSSNIPAEFSIARSEFIDAHNHADQSVRERLAVLKIASKTLLAQNIEALRKTPAAPSYSKSEKARVDGLLDELVELNGIRCDIVHSRMQVLQVNQVANAFFANVQDQQKLGRTGLLLTLNELRCCTNTLGRIAREISKLEQKPHAASAVSKTTAS
ncbi:MULTISPECIES: hypothetical protein [Qipengyuania]|uniref:Uncharacterized protein n=1 Tax=Qipengyuania soli TaxID=2782568 RepID=A0A7S8F6F5_9SPHN|nr:hypothetical protein [Qipengyuania soli]QPC99998.1 hypothetical protein IRL76_05550 [Qipengyuania soli]